MAQLTFPDICPALLRRKVLNGIAGFPFKRLSWGIQTTESVWVYWHCDGRAEISSVRDLSVAGVFVETAKLRTVGWTAERDFLVREGPRLSCNI